MMVVIAMMTMIIVMRATMIKLHDGTWMMICDHDDDNDTDNYWPCAIHIRETMTRRFSRSININIDYVDFPLRDSIVRGDVFDLGIRARFATCRFHQLAHACF